MQKAEVSSDKEILKHEVGRQDLALFLPFTVCYYARNIPILFIS